MARHPDADVAFLIVWTDMLSKDKRRSARAAARMFDDPRVEQFHDPSLVVGTELATRTFSSWIDKATAAMPADDPLRAMLLERPRDAPLWDVYLFHPAAARWTDVLPIPQSWIKHLGQGPDGQSFGWVNEVGRPPTSVDLLEEHRRLGDEWIPAAAMSP